MKHLGQRGKNAQLLIYLVVKIKSNDVKNDTAYETGMLGP